MSPLNQQTNSPGSGDRRYSHMPLVVEDALYKALQKYALTHDYANPDTAAQALLWAALTPS